MASNLQKINDYTEQLPTAVNTVQMPPAQTYDFDNKGNEDAPAKFRDRDYLISIEARSYQPGSPDLPGLRKELDLKDEQRGLTVVSSNFNNIDVIINAQCWTCILGFLHNLSDESDSDDLTDLTEPAEIGELSNCDGGGGG